MNGISICKARLYLQPGKQTLLHFSFSFYDLPPCCFFFFFFNDPAPTDISPLPPHPALPIYAGRTHALDVSFGRKKADNGDRLCHTWRRRHQPRQHALRAADEQIGRHVDDSTWSQPHPHRDRKSTRLNSSHLVISYAVFCLKK